MEEKKEREGEKAREKEREREVAPMEFSVSHAAAKPLKGMKAERIVSIPYMWPACLYIVLIDPIVVFLLLELSFPAGTPLELAFLIYFVGFP